ncbi:hypothetical protein F1880_000585 [Penicillium rolfsii]|nr:hypothetical protein F1880_000585 [Penicillium rolfsii]
MTLGLPDPNAPKIPASQPLLSAFLGVKPKKTVEDQSATANVDSITTENEDGVDTEVDSESGDTEAESDIFDDLDEDIIEQGAPCLQDAGIPDEAENLDDGPGVLGNGERVIDNNVSAETLCSLKNDDSDDEFSDCSVFDDVDIIREADAIAASRPSQPSQTPISHPTKSLAAPITTMGPPRSSQHLKSLATSIPSLPSLGDSFRDDTADYLEEVFARGCGDSFGELVQLGSVSR